MNVVVYFTKGVAGWVAQELASVLPGVTPYVETERFSLLSVPLTAMDSMLSNLRTVDDVRLLLAGPSLVRSEQDFISVLAAAESRIADSPVSLPRNTAWSITVSARDAPWKSRGSNWTPLSTLIKLWPYRNISDAARQPVDLRIQVDGDTLHVSVNAWANYFVKRKAPAGRLGALRPTVAATLVRAVESHVKTNVGIYDPCAGTGSILVEASALGHPVCGADDDLAAVQISRNRLEVANARSAAMKGTDIMCARDAALGFPQLPPGTCVASNLPWGKQIRLIEPDLLYEGIARGTADIVRAGGACVYLTTDPDRLTKRLRKIIPGVQMMETRIGLLGQTPTILEVCSQ